MRKRHRSRWGTFLSHLVRGGPAPRRKRSSTPRAAIGRSLVYESLETRRLLAADLLVRYELTDPAENVVDTLQVGDDFLLRVHVKDIRSEPEGVWQAYLDLNYNVGLVSVNGPITHGPTYNISTNSDTSVPGLIDEVGGLDTDQVAPVPHDTELLLFSVPFHVDAAGSLSFTAGLADHPLRGILFFDTVTKLQLTDIDFQGGSVETIPEGVRIITTPTSGLTTTEAGGTASFNVKLGAAPTAAVTIPLTSSAPAEGTVSPASVVLDAMNWNTGVTVMVTGQDDSVDDGNQAFTIVTGDPTSSDSNYDSLTAADVDDVSVTNQDDDVAGVVVDPNSGLVTTEAGGTATFTVTLTSQPTAAVTIPLSSDDTDEGTVAPASAVLDSSNWNTGVMVTVAGVNDDVVDMDQAYTIVTGDPSSADSQYNALGAGDVANVAVTNEDDDTAGISVNPTSGLVTTESGTADSFTITLTSQPTSAVTIPLSSSQASEGTVAPASAVLDSANWNTGVTVTVTGADDNIIDGDQAYTIITGDPTSADAMYNSFNAAAVADVAVTNQDDDMPVVVVSPTAGLTTDEDGGTDSFTITLASQPAAAVTIPLNSSDTGEGTVAPASAVLNASNWNTGVTVTVTGVNDDVTDENQDYTIVTGDPSSSDANYDALTAADVTDVSVTNVDNDVVGVEVDPNAGLITTELGGSDTFTITLTSQPSAAVTIPLSSSNLGEATVLPASAVLDAANWNTGVTVTVTGVDDDVIDGDVGYTILTGDPSSADGAYNALEADDVDDVAGTNEDDDVAGIDVDPTSGLVTAEDGTTAQFTITLTSQPAAAVTIPLSSSDPDEGTVAPASAVLDETNWDTGVTVTVTGVDDDVIDGTQAYTIFTGDPASADGNYNALDAGDVDNVSASNQDLDMAAVVVSPMTGVTTTEDGGTDSFTITLTSQPSAAVTIPLSSSNTSEGTVSPASAVLDATNWDTGVTVTLTGVSDDAIDGDQPYTIITGDPVSSDGDYNTLAPGDVADVAATNEDTDIAKVLVSPTSGLTTTEGGSAAQFTVTLGNRPTAAVTIPLSSSDPGEGTADLANVVLDDTNWDTGVTVTVTGVADDMIDGNQPYSIITGDPSSSDTDYDALAAADVDDVAVTNVDEDVPGVEVTPITGLTTTEDGGTATFTITLTSQPTAAVTIPLSSSDPGEGTVAPASAVLDAANWNTGVTVTVTGANDDVIDGPAAYMIVTGDPTSADTDYDGLTAGDVSDVSVSNEDNDMAEVFVVPTSGLATTEEGGTATFVMTLASQPTAAVTVPLSSTDVGEGTVAPASAVLDAGNWNTGVTVTITGVDDGEIDGHQGYTIITGDPSSVDGDYDILDAADVDDVSVTNQDDDAPSVFITPTAGLTTDEGGGTTQFTITLSIEPLAAVSIPLTSSDIAEGTVSPATAVLDDTNWNTGVIVTVTGVDDDVIDGNQSYMIETGDPASFDANYDALVAADVLDVSVTNVDTDIAAVLVSVTSGLMTDEDGTTDSFTITLSSRPAAPVTIPLTSNDTGEGAVSPAAAVLDDTNWDTGVVVTVTGADDDVIDGSQLYSIVTGDPSSTDANFDDLEPGAVPDVSVTNDDNDIPMVLVSTTSGLTTDEDGSADTFTITLSSQPTAAVTIPLTSSNVDEASVTPASAVLDSTNWNTGVTVTVTGVADDVIDGDQSFTIVTGDPSSSDGNYDTLAAGDVDDVTGTNANTDDAEILVSPTSLMTVEDGTSDSFTITLANRPSSAVSIPLSSSDTGEGTVAPASVMLDETNWDTGVTVTVTGVGDDVIDTDQVFTIITGDPSSSDANYDALAAGDVDDVTVTNEDVDVAAVIVSPTSGLITSENGGTDVFTVTLASQPASAVTIPVSSSNTGEGTVSPATVVLDVANWNTGVAVTVTGVDDGVIDMAQAYTIITGDPTSSDSNYDALTAADVSDVSVTNQDNDVPEVLVSPTTGLTTSEDGTITDSFTVTLSLPPTAAVTIPLTSSNTSEGTVTPAMVVLDGTNWDTGVVVTVTGVDDDVIDDSQPYTIVTGDPTSSDTNYDDLTAGDVDDVSVTNMDNDEARVDLSATTGLTTGEDGQTDSFTITLASRPSSPVTIPLSSSDTSEGTVVPASAVLDEANWNTGVLVTVTGVDDDVDDGNQAYSIITGDPSSADSFYNVLTADDVVDAAVTNENDDIAGVDVTPTTGLETDEDGGTDTFTIRLTSEPLSTVTIPVSSSDTGEGTLSPATVMLDASNWDTGVTVTVTGVSDDVIDDDQAYNIVTGDPSSADTGYDALTAGGVADVSATNEDLDVAGVEFSASSGLTTTEGGSTATFTITLASRPSAAVTIPLSSSDPSEATVSPTSIVLDETNWDTGIEVTITGVDDGFVDGDQPFTIITGDPTSSDPNFDALTAADIGDVSATNEDLDSATLTLAALSASQVEGTGGSTTAFTFEVTLSGDVEGGFRVAYNTNDGTATTADSDYVDNDNTLVFDGTDGETETITVLVNRDSKVEIDEQFSVVLGALSDIDPTAAENITVDGDPEAATVLNDDSSTLTISGVSSAEGTGGATTDYVFTVNLSNAVQGGFQIGYSTNDVTATVADGDYVDNDDALSFTGAAGEPRTITVRVNHDNRVEKNETFTVALGSLSGLIDAAMADDIDLVGSPANGTITNDDAAGVAFTLSSSDAIEFSGSHSISVVLTVASGATLGEDLTVDIVDLLSGTAQTPGDYSLDTTQVTFVAGSTDGATQTVGLTIVNDDVMEDAETVDLELQIAGSGFGSQVTVGSPGQHTVTISDDPLTGGASGVVWADTNNNGLKDAGEAPIPGVTITVVGQDLHGETVEFVTVTDSTGTYDISGLPGGTFDIVQTQPIAFHDGAESQGTVNGVASGEVEDDRFVGVVLQPTQQAVNYDFGERGLWARYVNVRMLLASTPEIDLVLRDAIADAEQIEGDPDLAQAIRDRSTPQISRIGSKVRVTGSSADDTFEMTPAGAASAADPTQHSIAVNELVWDFDASEVDTFFFDAGAGDDTVRLLDTGGNDSLEAAGNTVSLFNEDFRLDAIAFELARAISESGGTDQAQQAEIDFELELEGDWDQL